MKDADNVTEQSLVVSPLGKIVKVIKIKNTEIYGEVVGYTDDYPLTRYPVPNSKGHYVRFAFIPYDGNI